MFGWRSQMKEQSRRWAKHDVRTKRKWRAKNLTPWDGDKETSPDMWPMFRGGLPGGPSSPYWHDQFYWPSYVVLYDSQVERVLKRFRQPYFPHRIRKDMIQYFLRNFDSEGFVVRRTDTAHLGWNQLPLEHKGRDQVPVANTAFGGENEIEGLDDATDSTSGEVTTESGQSDEGESSDQESGSAGEEPEDTASSDDESPGPDTTMETPNGDQEEVIPDTTTSAHEHTHTESISDDTQAVLHHGIDDGVKKLEKATSPAPQPPASETASAPLKQEPGSTTASAVPMPLTAVKESADTASTVQGSGESVTTSSAPDIKQGSATPSANPRNTKGPSKLTKRLAENIELRQEVKKIRTESEQKSGMINALQAEVDDYREKMAILQKRLTTRNETVEDLRRENIAKGKQIINGSRNFGLLRGALSIQRSQISNLRSQLQKRQDSEAPKNRALAKLLYNFDQLYQVSEEDDEQEQEPDGFLESLKADLGKETYDEMLALGKTFEDQEE